MDVRRLNEQDAKAYWELRLLALQESPHAFADSYEEASQRVNPVEVIAQRLSGSEGMFTIGAFD